MKTASTEREAIVALGATPWLHIRPQNWNHDSAEIVGTVEGLTALRDAVENAIKIKAGACAVFANDGEGYSVEVRRSATVSGLGEPFYLDDYVDRSARTRLHEMVSHKRLIIRQNEEALDALRWCRANGNPHNGEHIKDQDHGRA